MGNASVEGGRSKPHAPPPPPTHHNFQTLSKIALAML